MSECLAKESWFLMKHSLSVNFLSETFTLFISAGFGSQKCERTELFLLPPQRFEKSLVSWCQFFRWFKFTLKPPNSITCGNLLSAIWDTSHWNFFVKFGLKTAWHISYDILWSLLTYVNFWQLQGHLSTFAKIWGPQKIKVFSMKKRSVVNKAWGFRWADNWATWWYHFLGGATHLRGGRGRQKKKGIFQDICNGLKGTQNWPIWPRISPQV